MSNNCSINLTIDKLPKVIAKTEYFLFQAMSQANVDFFQLAEKDPGSYLSTLLPIAKKLLDGEITDYENRAKKAEEEGKEQHKNLYQMFATNLMSISANWKEISANLAVYSSIFKSKVKFKLDNDGMVDLSQLADDEEALYKKFIVDQSANEIDPFDTIDKAVELFIRSIPKSSIIIDEFGIGSNVDYASFVKTLMIDLKGAITIKEIISKLKEKKEKTPEYQHIIDMLEFKSTDDSRNIQLKINFRNSFAKADIPIYTTSVEGNIIKVFEATKNKRSSYEKKVETAFFLRGMPVVIDGQVVNLAHKDSNGAWVIDETDVKKIEDYITLSPVGEKTDRKIQFLKALGFSFSPETEKIIKDGIDKSEKDSRKTKFDYIYEHLINRLTKPSNNKGYGPFGKKDTITNPISALKKDWNKPKSGQNNAINDIIELELKYNSEYNTQSSVINPEGNIQNSNQLHNNFTVLNKFISDPETYPTIHHILEAEPSMSWLNPKTNPTIKDNILLNSLFFLEDPASDNYGKRRRVTYYDGEYKYSTESGEFVKINIVNTGGVQQKENGNKEDAASSTALNEADKLLQDINLFLKAGFSSTLRLSDKSTDLGIFANFYLDSVTGKPYKRILGSLAESNYSDVFSSQSFLQGFTNELKDIVAMKYLAKKGFYENLKFASENALNSWGEFDNILSDVTKATLDELLNDSDVTSVDLAKGLLDTSVIKSQIEEDVKIYFKKYSEEFLKKLSPIKKMVDSTYLTTSKNFDDVAKYYLASTFLIDLGAMKLFFGSSIHFKDFTKRASKDSATGIFTFLEEDLIRALNDRLDPQGYGVNTNLGGRLLAERLFLQGKITADQKSQIEARQEISANKDFKSAVIQDVKFNSKQAETILENIKTLYQEKHISEESYKLFEKNISEVISSKYTGKEGDGQGYVTFDFYRTMSILTNAWSEKQEKVYKKITEYSHYDELAQEETDEVKKAEYIAKRDAVGYDPAEQVYFPPKKFQYSGPMKHEEFVDASLYNALIPMFDKFSLFPLIPTIVKGREQEDLLKRMMFEGLSYVKFETGSKTETPKNQDSLYVNYDPNNPEKRYIKTFNQRLLDGDTKFLSEHTLYMSHLKEQVKIDAAIHEDVIFGSQARKLILMNLLSLTTTHNKEEFTRLYNQYKGFIDDLVQIEKTVVYNKIGINNKGETLKLTDINKLVEYFIKEINKKNQDSNVLKAIEYNPTTKQFKIPLDAAVQAQVIEGILISSINNNIVRYKTSGSMLTQVSITGTGAKKFSKDASEKALETFGNSELKYYDISKEGDKRIVTAMQVKVGFTKQWLPLLKLMHTDKSPIESLERLNEMLKDESWVKQNRDSIRMISYRIPTQGRNFLDVMEVAEFLPAQFGDAIIMPSEAIIKSGSDFDIDKMFVFYANLNSQDGTYQKAEYNQNDLKMPDADLYRGAVQNRLYKTMAEIILHPNNYMELVTPSDNFHIDPIVNKIYIKLGLMSKDAKERPKTDYKHTDILNRNRNIEKFLSLLNGKSDLGIAALANTFNVLYQISNAKANPKFFEPNGIKSFFDNKFMSKDEKNLIQELYYGDIYDEDGMFKSEFFSEFINAFVDVARDDYVFGINVVTEFSPMIFYMKFSGLSSKKILAFINQPILRRYIENLSKYENMFVQNYINQTQKESEKRARLFNQEDMTEDNPDWVAMQDELYWYRISARKKALAETLQEFGFNDIKATKKGISVKLEELNYNNPQFDAQTLYDNIRPAKNFLPSSLTEDQKKYQLAVLFEMLNQKEQADSMTNAQRFLNFDTKPYSSNFEVYVKNIEYQKAVAANSTSNILSQETLKAIKKDSVISALDVSVEIRTLLETLLPTRNNRQLDQIIHREALSLREDFKNKNVFSEEDMFRFARTAKNDFMNYILQNYFNNSEEGKAFFKKEFNTEKSLNNYLKELIETDKITQTIIKIQNSPSYEAILKKFPIVGNLIVQPGENNPKILSYSFLENGNNPVEKQSMIYQFDEIVSIESETFKDLKTLFKDLALYSIFQSGYNSSDISYTSITPITLINPLYGFAIKEFEKLNPNEKIEKYNSFFSKFKLNNPVFYGKKSTETITGEISKTGKWYAEEDLKIEKKPVVDQPVSVESKVTENDKELKMSSYFVDAIKAGTKKSLTRAYVIKNGVYKLVNEENNNIFVEIQFYKRISALDLDAKKRENYAKSEGYGSWASLETKIKEGKHAVLKPQFLTGDQKVDVYLIKYLPEKSKATEVKMDDSFNPVSEKSVKINKLSDVERNIKENLPKEIADSIEVLDVVPQEILGRDDLYLSMKETLEKKGITDPFLINWFGINLPSNVSRGQIIKSIVSESQIEKIASDSYNKLLKFKDPILKNKDIKESFDKWVKALENYPIAFKDLMLKHAIKHLRNPERRAKFVLQLSAVALQQTYGIAVNKPHELNRIGKLYDLEVLKTVSDAVGHEPSASGKGYWVHIPRIENIYSSQFKANVELLKKLSPSSWCTASGMAVHYVENYDNYLLIVDGITVVGIEAYPTSKLTKALFERNEDGSTYVKYFENDEELYEYAEETRQTYTILQRARRASEKIKVKEVTSRGNNGVASIDHLDDTIAFFEKHNLDLDNPSVKRAIKAKAEGKTDKDYINFDDEGRYYDPFEDQEPDWEYEEPYYMEALQEELEQQRREWEGEREFVSNITTEEEARADINLIKSHYESLNPTLRAIKEIAEAAVFADSHNIAHVDPTLPFYNDLAISAVNKLPAAFQYLSEAGKNIPGLKQIYDAHQKELDTLTLPFSKTNANLIQGYYDAKNDKVVVIASNTPVNEAAKVGIHEVAHRGMVRMAKDLGGETELFQVLKNAEKELMKKLPELLKRTGHKTLDSLMLDYGFDISTKEGELKLLSELAARWAETLVDKPKPIWWKKLLQSVSNWIKQFIGKTLTESEVNELVGGFVKLGSKQDIEGFKEFVTQPTQATALDYLINKYDWSKPTTSAASSATPIVVSRQEIQPGFFDYGKLSSEDEKIILNEAIKQTNKQGYPVKKGVVYAHWGNMWAVTDKGADAFPVFGKYLRRSEESAGLGKGLNKIDLPKSNINHNDGGKGWYDYYPTDQNGDPLTPIPQVVKDILQKKLGIDMSVYDAAIINSYGETTELSRHIDNTEDKGYAYQIPIVSISLIGDSIFQYSDPSNNPTHTLPDNKKVSLSPGQVVIFGGPSRAIAHRVLNGKSGNAVNIENTVNSLKTERINITLRRALPLSKEQYEAWVNKNKQLQSQSMTPVATEIKVNPLVAAGVKPTDMYGNAAKDIQMASESTQFIGFGTIMKEGNISSTDKYAKAWGNKANTGVYSANDIIMISGSGNFGRGGVDKTEEATAIKQTLTEKYKPLLEKAVAAGASFRVGNQYAKGNLSDELVAKYLQQKGYIEEKLNGYSRWTAPKSTTSAASTEVLQKINNFRAELPQTLKGKLDGSKLSEVEGKLEANKDRLIELLGSSMYSEKLKDVVYKELLQNAFDATKIAESKGLIDKGKIDIEINEKERIISFTDNGIGMTSDIVQKAFFTIGGTYKGDGIDNKLKSGGLGLAKMAFIFGSERLILETVHNGVKTTVNATSQEIRTDNFKIKSEQTNEKNGTKVSVKIPKTYVDSKGENRDIDFPMFVDSEFEYSFLKNPLIGNVDINYSIINRESSYRKEEKLKTNLGDIPEGYVLFSPAKTSFADMNIYIDTKNITKGSFFDTTHKILSSGLYQFDVSFETDDREKIPLNIIIDIKPKVDATNAQYPFNNQRENFKPTVKNDISALNKYLALLWKSIEIELLKSSFNKIKNIDAVDVENVDNSVITKNKEITKSFAAVSNSDIIKTAIEDFNKKNKEAIINNGGLKTEQLSLTKEDIDKDAEKAYGRTFKAEKEISINKETGLNLDSNKPIIHNNTDMTLDEKSIKFLSEISSIMIEYKKSIIDFYGEEYGALMKDQLWGVSIDKNYGGVNVHPSFLSMVAINPFYMFPANAKIDAVNWIAVALDHLIIHELNHNFERNEGAGFTGRFLLSYADVHSIPNHFELISKLKLSIKNNLEIIKKLNYEYEQSENVESGFEGNKLEANNKKRTDTRIETLSNIDTTINDRADKYDTRSSEKFGEIINSTILGSKQNVEGFKKFVTQPLDSSNEEIEKMYNENKFSGETIEEFLNRMSCLGKLK